MHLSYCLHVMYKTYELNELPDYNKSLIKNLDKYTMPSYQQANDFDCGLYVIAHAKEFIESVCFCNKKYTISETKSLANKPIENKDKKSEIWFLQLRKMSLFILKQYIFHSGISDPFLFEIILYFIDFCLSAHLSVHEICAILQSEEKHDFTYKMYKETIKSSKKKL